MSVSARPGPVPADFAPAVVTIEKRRDGTLVLRSPQPLGDYPPNLACLLPEWAGAAPDRLFLAERQAAGPWRTLTYAQAASGAASVAGAILDRGLDRSRRVMVLSGNGIDHALLMLG